jgi:peptidyl-prolyl cis-trans isomerase SurA
MRRLPSVIAGILLATAAGQIAAQRITLIDRVVAVVNKDVVTLSELRERVEQAARDLRRQGTEVPPREILEKQMLERLILDKAMIHIARDLGIRVDDAQLDRSVERIAESNQMSLSEFRRNLERDGISFERFRLEVRDQILLQRVREREVDDKVDVSDSEIDAFIAQQKDSPGPMEFNFQHILVRVPDQASPERIEVARQRAEKAKSEAQAGDFARVAASYSDAPEALRGGEMGWRAEDRVPELFVEPLRKMPVGGLSEVLRSPAGFHILKLVERRGAEVAARVEQTRARHILVRTNEVVSENEARRRLLDLRERVVTGGQDFGALARLHSADTSAARGGDLDWVLPGDTVPEFERAMTALAPGQVSPPVKTGFGWHLIQVLERRTAELSNERKRLEARQAIRARKSEEAFEEWLRQIRDEAYVDIRLEER